MGVLDKIKNIFFEEEYVEVEEPKVKKETKQEKVPVAKKIDLPEIKKDVPKEEKIEETIVEEPEIVEENIEEPKFKFPMVFEEDDFKEEVIEEKFNEPEVEKKPIEMPREEVKYHYENERVPLYEGREEKKEKAIFKPTPIISPIYGILDKNYKKDEIVTKKPVILSSASSKKMDFDRVRQKAYGDLASDITESMLDEETKNKQEDTIVKKEEDSSKTKDININLNHEKDTEEENTFYDLNVNSPAVNKVTVGDAEEYFNDLGLEYNVDYKDNSIEKASGRRSDSKKEDTEDAPLENNLFDLLESMYEDKEEE